MKTKNELLLKSFIDFISEVFLILHFNEYFSFASFKSSSDNLLDVPVCVPYIIVNSGSMQFEPDDGEEGAEG